MRETMATSTSSLPASLFDAHDLMDEEPSQLGAFAVLPHEVLLIALSYIQPKDLLTSVSLVSKSFRGFALDDHLWRRLCLLRWGDTILKETEGARNPDEGVKSSRRKLQWGWVYRWRSLVERNWWRGQCSTTTIACPAEITCVQTDGLTIASGSYDHKVRVWDLVKAQWVGDAEAVDETNANLDEEPEPTDGDNEGFCKAKKHVPTKVLTGHSHRVYCLQFSGNTLVSGSDDHSIKVWNVEQARCTNTFIGHTRAVRTLQFADDGTLVSGSYDKTVKVWDMQTGKDKATLKSHTTCICCLKFNDRMIVSGSFKAIKLWDTKTYKPITELQGHESWVTGIQFDDVKLVSGSMDNTIKMWDLRNTAYPFWTIGEHSKRVRCLQYDAGKLCSGSYDFTIKVWDLAARACVVTLKGHNASARSLHFTDDVLVSGSLDKSIKIWDFSANVPFE